MIGTVCLVVGSRLSFVCRWLAKKGSCYAEWRIGFPFCVSLFGLSSAPFPFSLSLISLMVSVDVKHHVNLHWARLCSRLSRPDITVLVDWV